MEAKHTKGEWYISEGSIRAHNSRAIISCIRSDRPINQIATVHQVDIPNAETEANAKLIAAAPELLQIAVKCLHWCNNAESFDFVMELKKETEAAIKKATE